MASRKVEKAVIKHMVDNKDELVKNGLPEKVIDWLSNNSVAKEISYAQEEFMNFEGEIKNKIVLRFLDIIGIYPYKKKAECDLPENVKIATDVINSLKYNSSRNKKGETIDICFYNDKKIYTFKRSIDIKKKKAYFEITFDYAEDEKTNV